MTDKRYPTRMHEMLGVETEEQFTYSEYGDRKFWLSESGLMYSICDDGTSILTTQGKLVLFINHPECIIRKPRLTEEAQEKEDHIIRLERMRSQKDQWANGKHAHWLETPADHAKDRDALDAAIEALTGKPRLSEEQVAQLRALVTLGWRWLAKDETGDVFAYGSKPQKIMSFFYWNNDEDGECFSVMKELSVCALVSWSDPEPLDIVATLKTAGVEVEE